MCGSNRGGGGGVVPRQVFSFFAGGLQFFSGAFSRNLKHIVGILSSSPVDWHPFGANWVRGGGCGTCPKVRGTDRKSVV